MNADSPEPRRAAIAATSTSSDQPERFFWRAWSTDGVTDPAFRRSVWEEVCANAERHNDPGNFTAFIGYEWTPSTQDPKSPNLHRNMIFEGGAEEACQVLPFSIHDSKNVEDLWAYLEDYEERIGGKVLAIPHNGNLSSGAMFALTDYDGNRIDADYAQTRARWEPLYEVTQYKGDGETHPLLSPTDEFADYETWRPDTPVEQKRTEYARSALKAGTGAEGRARGQSLQVRHDRQHRRPHLSFDRGREQLLGQDLADGAQPLPDQQLDIQRLRNGGGVGNRQHQRTLSSPR